MRTIRLALSLALALAVALPWGSRGGPTSLPSRASTADEPPLRALADAAFRLDIEGIESVRDRLAAAPEGETPAEKARRLYRVALAEWHLGQARSGDPEEALAAARRADERLGEALELDPELARAWALRNRVGYLRFLLGESRGEDGVRLFRETRSRAMELAPEDPLVALVDAAALFYTPEAAGGDAERGLARTREAIASLEQAAPEDPHAALWLPVAWSWLGSMHLGRGDGEAAREAFTAALEVRPDYAYVRRSLLPMTEPVTPGAPPQVPPEGWIELAADPVGDGRLPGLADVESLAWSWDEANGRIWFRFGLARPPGPRGFGVNVALDVDGSQETGAGWWASGDGFRYDRLITVWVMIDDSGGFRGAVGMADHREVAAGTYAASPPGTVTFARDPGGESILVGVRREALEEGPWRLVGTVGSPTDWNDSTPDSGWATLEGPQSEGEGRGGPR